MDQSEPLSSTFNPDLSDLRVALIKALEHERKYTPIPSAVLKLSAKPLLVIVDADSLGEHVLIEILRALISAEPECSCIVSANRPLPVFRCWAQDQPTSIEVDLAPPGANEVDLTLSRCSIDVLQQKNHSAVLVLTQDRDLLGIALRWRQAKCPAFIVPLRQDETAKALLNRCERQGVSTISIGDLLNLCRPDVYPHKQLRGDG